MARLLSLFALFLSSVRAAEPLFEVGASCNVSSRDFVSPDFFSHHTVAGAGCTGANANETGCFCAPVLNNEERLSDWVWQCGDDVSFGPKQNKTCPAELPVPFLNMSTTGTSVESMLTVPAYCNMSLHPSGQFGDEVCSYSTCENGGDFSAVCACVDTEKAFDVEGGPQLWYCLQSKCGCGEEDEEKEDDDHSEHDNGADDHSDKTNGTVTAAGTSGTFTLSVMTAVGVALFVVSVL